MILLYFIITCLLVLLVKKCLKPKHFPPGPPRLPYFGSLPYIVNFRRPFSPFHDLRPLMKRYGKVCGFYFGNTPTVMISDYELLKDILKREEASQRPSHFPFNENREGKDFLPHGEVMGIVMANGTFWREQRRFVARNLRDLGFGKNSMEVLINTEVKKYIQKFKLTVGEPIKLNQSLNVSVVNALWHILTGVRFELDDPKLDDLITLVNRMFKEGSFIGALPHILPSMHLLKLPGLRKITGYEAFCSGIDRINDMVGKLLTQHLTNFSVEKQDNLLDIYIGRVFETKDQSSSFYGEMGMAGAVNCLYDLFLAGMETTTSSLVWTCLYLVHHPEVQDRVSQEIMKVIGPDRAPTLQDQPDMPYTNAVIHESFRLTSLVFFSLPHKLTDEVQVKEFVIPANATIIPNLYDIMHDPDHFECPEEFRPERFLDEQGRFNPHNRVVPFSMGKRVCLGQPLAEREFFLFLVGILQAFKLKNPQGQSLPSIKPEDTMTIGITRVPPDFEVIFELR